MPWLYQIVLYNCNQWPKDFSQNGTLKKHSRNRSEEKSYQWNQCQKAFSQDESLETPLRIQPYPCKQWPKAFSDRGSLKKYLKIDFLMLVYLTLPNDRFCSQNCWSEYFFIFPIYYQFCCKCSKTGKNICLSYILFELWTQYKICFQI